MAVRLNTILEESEVDPVSIRLVRHKDPRCSPGRSPCELWRDDRKAFELYQSIQRVRNRKIHSAPFWAVFVADAFDDTVLAGLYAASYQRVLEHDKPMPHLISDVDRAGTCDCYDLTLDQRMPDLMGRLIIDWGRGERAWGQYADRQNKVVREIRITESTPPYPGHLNFIQTLSRMGKFSAGWIDALRTARGVYILTCPRTKEQYVGSASGESGFWGRRMQYVRTGHSGDVALRSRDPNDYQVAILEVAGSAADQEEILAVEGRWQRKLQSRNMGLNRNLASSARPPDCNFRSCQVIALACKECTEMPSRGRARGSTALGLRMVGNCLGSS